MVAQKTDCGNNRMDCQSTFDGASRKCVPRHQLFRPPNQQTSQTTKTENVTMYGLTPILSPILPH